MKSTQKKILPDTFWHVGYVNKEENDPRRHKARCYYYSYGHCSILNENCIGSSHCEKYAEREKEKYKHQAYGHSYHGIGYFSREIMDFCSNDNLPIKEKSVWLTKECPLCGNKIEAYHPLKNLARYCEHCRIIFINKEVYATYTEDVNRALCGNILCLMQIEHKTEIKKVQEVKKQSKSTKKSVSTNKKNYYHKKEKLSANALGNDPRFKDLFASFK